MSAASELLLFRRVLQRLAAVLKASVCGSLLFNRAARTLAAVLNASGCGSLFWVLKNFFEGGCCLALRASSGKHAHGSLAPSGGP